MYRPEVRLQLKRVFFLPAFDALEDPTSRAYYPRSFIEVMTPWIWPRDSRWGGRSRLQGCMSGRLALPGCGSPGSLVSRGGRFVVRLVVGSRRCGRRP